MTTDEKSHTQTQITRDIETFLAAAQTRAAQKGIAATIEEIRALAKEALASADRGNTANAGGSEPQAKR